MTDTPLIEYRVLFYRSNLVAARTVLPEVNTSGWLAVLAPDETAARMLLDHKFGRDENGRRWGHISRFNPTNRDAWVSGWPTGEFARWCTVEPATYGS